MLVVVRDERNEPVLVASFSFKEVLPPVEHFWITRSLQNNVGKFDG
jgi:hypothetical protein